ncbi:MAG: transglutaminase family protein [Bacteroidales bacterium]|nr:transglutaminase family protein [Bacteroidales bacterium]
MKRYLIFLLILFSTLSFAQKELDPAWLEIPVNLKKDANTILRDYQVEYKLMSNQDLEVKVLEVITILDNEGKENAPVVWHYDVFSKYIFGEIQVYNKNGERVEKISLREMDDYGISGLVNFFDDSRLKVFEPEIKETPYTIIITYTKEYNGLLELPPWILQGDSEIAVENASLTIINTGGVQYKIIPKNMEKSMYNFTDEGELKRWEIKNKTAFRPESFVKDSQLPYIKFPLEEFQLQGYDGNTKSWQGFGKWSSELIQNRDQLPEETIAKIKELVVNAKDEKEKAQIIYDWMQENTRYISIQYGIGGWQPFYASEVDETKYGDCKALTNYTKALLKAADIDSYYSLVTAGAGEKNLDPKSPSNQFNHVILCVPFSGDTTWVECTADDFAIGYLGDFTDDRYALLIDGDQSKLVKTTAYTKAQNTQIRAGVIQINPNGSLQAKIKTVYGGVQTKYRFGRINEDEKDRKDYLYRVLDLPGFKITGIGYEYKKEKLPSIIENLELEAEKYTSVTGSRMFVPLNFLNTHTVKPKSDTARKNNIYQTMAYTDIDSLVYQIPSGYKIERLPEGKKLESEYGSYQSTISVVDDQIIYVRKMEQNSGDFPAKGWAEFRKYRLEITKADKATAILKKTLN